MVRLSQLQPDPHRTGEFLATLWQGQVPKSLILHKWLYLDSSPRTILLLWEGDDDARAYVERVFGGSGALTTQVVTDATEGLALCFNRDLEGFGRWLEERGATEAEIERQLKVRRQGRDAPTPELAISAGRAWMAERQD
jgi:hypothetical protein